MKIKIFFYLTFFVNIPHIHTMEQPSELPPIKKQTSATELLQKMVIPKPLRRTLSSNGSEQWINKEVCEMTRDYRRDAEEAIFEKDAIKFSTALQKIGDPQDRADLTRRWNLLRGQKVSSPGRFDIKHGGSLLAHHKRLDNQTQQ